MSLRLALPLLLAVTLNAAQNGAAAYSGTADRLIDAALKDDTSLARLEYLCYRIGNRLSGSKTLDIAIAW